MSTIPDPPQAWPEYPPPAPTARPRSRTKVTLGFIFAAVGLVLIPIGFNTAALVLGIQAHREGDRLGRWVIGAAVASFVLSIAIAVAFLNASDSAALVLR